MLLALSLVSFSQKNKKPVFYFWDSAGKAVNEEKAFFFTLVSKTNDTCYQVLNYEIMGPLVSSEEFKDKEGKIRHGRSSYMRIDGTLDSTGHFTNSKPNGAWMYFNPDGNLINHKQYLMGELVSEPRKQPTPQEEKVEYNPDVQSQFNGGFKGMAAIPDTKPSISIVCTIQKNDGLRESLFPGRRERTGAGRYHSEIGRIYIRQ